MQTPRVMTAAEEEAFFRWPRYGPDAEARLLALLRAGETSWSAGTVEPFERDLAALFGVRFALACTNGTSAAYLALRALGVGPGDTVVAAALGHWASVLPALQCGARVLLADVLPGTCRLDPAAVAPLLDDTTRAVVVTHLFGAPAPVAELRALCAAGGVALLEDASHAQGALVEARPVGSFGDASFTSFQAQKLIAGGEGGALLTSDEELYFRALALGHPRRLAAAPEPWRRLAGSGEGFKFTPSALPVALAHEALRGLAQQNAVRREACEQFRRLLVASGLFAAPPDDAGRVFYRCELALPPGLPAPAGDRVVAALRSAGARVDRFWGYLPALHGRLAEASSSGRWPYAKDAWRRTLLFDPFTAYDPEFVEGYAARILRIVAAAGGRDL